VVDIVSAQEMANKEGLDLVEIVPNAEPPVCRLMDYGRFRFDQKKKQAEARKKQKQVQVKEVKFRPGTDIGDYQVKLRNLTRFLNEGDKAKVTMRFRGREHAHRELGLDLLQRVESDLAEISIVEQQPQMEGRQMVMVLGPKKK
jgi:translation initiation factor IF-3